MVIIWYMVIINGEWWFIIIWLVVLTILKNMSQWEGWHPIYDMENNNWLKPPTSDKQLEITGHHLEWLIVISSYFKKVMICYDSNNLIFNLRFKLLISITCAVLIPSSRARHCYSNWWWVIISHDHPQKLDPVTMKPPQRSYTSRWCIQHEMNRLMLWTRLTAKQNHQWHWNHIWSTFYIFLLAKQS